MKSIDILKQKLQPTVLDKLTIPAKITMAEGELKSIETEVDEILCEVVACKTINSANPKLNKLCVLQELLCALCFKHKISLTQKLRRLVGEFDRCDDPDLRAFVFAQIKSGIFLR